MNYVIETDRLGLREFTFDDADFIIELLNSPGWIRYIGDRNVKEKEQAINYLHNGPMKSYRENGFGLSCIVKKEDNKPIGMCGIIWRENLDNPDIGFALLPGYNGKGYAYEIANATMQYAKKELNLSKIAAITLPENASSIKLLEKLGLTFVNEFTFPGSEEVLLLYSN